MMSPEELFEKLINNEITREEFESLLEGLDDEHIRSRYDEYLEAKFMEELDAHFIESDNELPEDDNESLEPELKIKPSEKRREEKSKRTYPIAAVILVFIGVTFGILFMIVQFQPVEDDQANYLNGEDQILTKYTPNRRMFRMRLDDGSLVHLNAVSSISYPQKFMEDKREVEISGEAYFDIERDESRPFNIKVKDYSVQVLGTSFNIKAYEDEDNFSVTVESGTVRVVLDIADIEPVILTKDKKLIYSPETGEAKIISVKAEEELSWRKGILHFDSTPMAEVEKMLERWYGYDVVIEDEEIYELRIGGDHHNESIKSVMESIKYMTRTQYLIKDNSIIIKN